MHLDNRSIILSSFDPSICLLARHKQLRYPVFFLTASGTQLSSLCAIADAHVGWEDRTDERKQTLQAGIRFAKRAGLYGVVSESHVRFFPSSLHLCCGLKI